MHCYYGMIKKCRGCLLYDKTNGICQVRVVIEGEDYELPVKADDECHWIKLDLEVDRALKESIKKTQVKEIRQKMIEEVDIPVAVKEVRVWSEGNKRFTEER